MSEKVKKTGIAPEQEQQDIDFFEQLIELKRTSKKTKGGNRFRFTALMVVGDRNGNVGVGLGKAKDVSLAIKKGVRQARKAMFPVELVGDAKTIAHDIKVKYKAAQVLLKPAPLGTGVIAGGAVRTIAEAAGIRNIVGKIIGSNNKKSNVKATIAALQGVKPMSARKVRIGSKEKTNPAKK